MSYNICEGEHLRLVVNLLTGNVDLQAEARAEFAEKTVKKLQKEVDRLEGQTLLKLITYLLNHYNCMLRNSGLIAVVFLSLYNFIKHLFILLIHATCSICHRSVGFACLC